jgi:hypothetical protein
MAAANFVATLTVVGGETSKTTTVEAARAVLAPAGAMAAPLLLIDVQSRAQFAGAGAMTSTPLAIEMIVDALQTNKIDNNSMQGAVAGSPGTMPTHWSVNNSPGLTQTISLSTVNGVDVISLRFNGTPTSTGAVQPIFMLPAGALASFGQDWDLSAYLAIIAGSTTNVTSVRLSYNEQPLGGGFLAFHNGPDLTSILTSTLTRYSYSATNTQGATGSVRPVFTFSVTIGQPVDITFSIGWPQLELGTAATAAIRTTGAASDGMAPMFLMTAGVLPEQFLGTTLAGGGAITADVIPEQFISVSLAGAGSIAAGLRATEPVLGAFAGAGAITADVIPEQFISVSLAGAGSIAAGLRAADAVTVTFAAAGSLGGGTLTREQVLGAFVGAGAITAPDILPQQFVTNVLAGVGSMAAAPESVDVVVSALNSAGSIAAAAGSVGAAISLLSGAGALAADFLPQQFASAVLAGSGLLSANLAEKELTAAAFVGLAALSADFAEKDLVAAALVGSATLGTDFAAAGTGRAVAAAMAGAGALRADLGVISAAAAGEPSILGGHSARRRRRAVRGNLALYLMAFGAEASGEVEEPREGRAAALFGFAARARGAVGAAGALECPLPEFSVAVRGEIAPCGEMRSFLGVEARAVGRFDHFSDDEISALWPWLLLAA